MIASDSVPVKSEPRAIEGDIDGPKFFSRSGFRSGYFVVGVIVSLGAVAYDASTLYRRWQVLSTTEATLLLMTGYAMVELLLKTLGARRRMYDIYLGALPPEKPRGMSVDGLLDLAANSLIQPLFLASFVMFMLLIVINQVLPSTK